MLQIRHLTKKDLEVAKQDAKQGEDMEIHSHTQQAILPTQKCWLDSRTTYYISISTISCRTHHLVWNALTRSAINIADIGESTSLSQVMDTKEIVKDMLWPYNHTKDNI